MELSHIRFGLRGMMIIILIVAGLTAGLMKLAKYRSVIVCYGSAAK